MNYSEMTNEELDRLSAERLMKWTTRVLDLAKQDIVWQEGDNR